MDSFELNKIMGAILATCLGVLTLNIAAGAIFTPGKLEKPGYAVAVPDQPAGGTETAKPEPAEPIAGAARKLRSAARARRPPSNARPATPSKRAARTGSARTCTASSTAPRLRSQGSITRQP